MQGHSVTIEGFCPQLVRCALTVQESGDRIHLALLLDFIEISFLSTKFTALAPGAVVWMILFFPTMSI
jgi:hypothetical protein